nr:MBL fold metallo-hydrolase [Sphingomonas sp. Y57]
MKRKLNLGAAALALCIAAMVAGPASANDVATKAAPAAGTIKLTFLGTGAPRPSERRSGPATLVEAGPFKILVDAGSGTREQMFRAGGWELITGLSTILLTHLHYDHMIDVPDITATGWMYGRRVPMTVYGPRGTVEMADHFHAAFKWDLDMRELVGIPMAGSGFDAHDIGPGVIFDKDGLKITAFEVEHMPIDVASGQRLKFADGSDFYGQTLGYRIDYMGHSVLFSGDTRSTAASQIIANGKNVDVLVHEVQVPSKGGSKEARLANMSLSVHSTPAQAGAIFEKTSPRMAVYNHIIPPDTDVAELTSETRPSYKGPLTVAEDFMTITIGDRIVIGEQPRSGTHIFEKATVVQDK